MNEMVAIEQKCVISKLLDKVINVSILTALNPYN